MNTKSALIGFSGFVGKNISLQCDFDYYFNSSNVHLLKNNKYDLVVCAGVPAVKWWANKNPSEDNSVIRNLIDLYGSISCDNFVLISTVDVYPLPVAVDELSDIDIDNLHAYGRNRLILENALKDRFKSYHIVRLPALFGEGLKKNILFDLINGNQIDKINPLSSYQWYPLSRLWSDIKVILENNIKLINLVTEPIITSEILHRFFPSVTCSPDLSNVAAYDVETIYSNLFNYNANPYLIDRDAIMNSLSEWLKID